MTSIPFEDFHKIRNIKKTFLEIANHERRENLYSDILAFFLKPNEAHKLDAKVLTALLKLAKPDFEVTSLGSVYVSREFGTENRKRIDLFIHTGNYVIGIENKIDHSLENDLDEYNNTLKDYATKGVEVVRIILSLKKVTISTIPKEYKDKYKLDDDTIVVNKDKENSWKVILYQDLFDKLIELTEISTLKQLPYFDYLEELFHSTKPLDGKLNKSEKDKLDKSHEDKKEYLLPLQEELAKKLPEWKTWGQRKEDDERLSDGCSVYYNQFEKSNIQIYAYATFKKTESQYCEIVWHVGLQLDGNIRKGKVSPRLFKLFYEESNELGQKGYNYNTGNGRAGKYREYPKETKIDVIYEELLWLKDLVEPRLKNSDSIV
jgi:PD-(D/E)XK nuclease superfamily